MSQPTLTPAAQAIAWKTVPTSDGSTSTFAHLGWVDLDGTEWTIHANVDPDRYAKYGDNPELAAHPDVFRAPGVNLLTYPVPGMDTDPSRMLFHAPAFLAKRFPEAVPALDWSPRVLVSGHVVQEATVLTIEDTDGLFPVIARVDTVFNDLNDGNLVGAAVTIGEGTDRRLIVPVLSTDATATDVLNQLAESRRFS